MKKTLFILLCLLSLCAYPLDVWSQTTPSQDAGSSGGGSAGGFDPTVDMGNNTNTATGSVSRDSLAKTSLLIAALKSADDMLKANYCDATTGVCHEDVIPGLVQRMPKDTDDLIWKDNEKIQKSAASAIGRDNSHAKEVAGIKTATALQGARLTQTDRDAQNTLLMQDTEIKLLALARYHWLTLDYGPAREYALKPYEFGYVSYHSALADTMGDYSDLETIYSDVYGYVQAGTAIVGSMPYVMNGINNAVTAVQDYRKNSAAGDVAEAQGAAAQATADYNDAMDAAMYAEMEAAEAESEAMRLDLQASMMDQQIAAADKKAAEARAAGDAEAEKAAIEESAKLAQEQASLREQAAEQTQIAQDKRAEEESAYAAAEEAEERYNDAKKAEVEAKEDLADMTGVTDAREERAAAQADANKANAAQAEATRKAGQADASRQAAEGQATAAREREAAANSAAADLDAKAAAAERSGNKQLATDYKQQADAKRQEAAAEAEMATASEKEAAAYKDKAAEYQAEADEHGRDAAEATADANVAARKEALATSEYEKLTGEKPE